MTANKMLFLKKSGLLAIGLTAIFTRSSGQQKINADSIKNKLTWFADAKLGIFIHWGIYAVNGIDESWSFYNKKISYPDYMKQLSGFTAAKYNPEAWAALINESGAKYAVMTTKHHDGVALWPTKQNQLNVVDRSPAKRDLVAPFFKALDKYGIKKGAYYSLLDWSNPDYPGFKKDSSGYKIADAAQRWQRFIQFDEAQIDELNKNYRPDLWWFDGDWEHTADEWHATELRKRILNINPHAIINGRLMGFGDYDTPEQNFPVTRPNYNWWELCLTINNNWGYQPQDTAWKTPYEIINIFTDVISNGGNLLLDIGPMQDGTIPDPEVHVLKELGQWTKKHDKAIYGTLGGMPPGHFYGASTLSKDSTTLYLFVPAKTSSSIVIKGLSNKIEHIGIMGTSKTVQPKIVGKISWSPIPGLVYINIPQEAQDKYMTVLAIQLDKPLKLYRGAGGLK
ncbi:MAG: alpha-L-fucosidase [Bacteroidota bacterium]